MPRANLVGQLQQYRAQHVEEGATVDRMVDLLVAQPRCFDRDCWTPGHVTGSAWVVDRSAQRVLLTHHRKLNRWLQLGGHADGDEHPLRVAQREGEEESGLLLEPVTQRIFDIDIHEIPPRHADPAHLHYDIRFAFAALLGDAFVVGEESHALKWVSIDRLGELTDEPSMLRMARKWQGRRF